MDNITHTLVGAALAETGLKRWTPLATPALLLGANFPDLDIVVGFDKLQYLEHHRGITHALIALPIQSLLLAGLLYGGSRWRQRRNPAQPRARFGALFVLSLLAMVTHPLLDFTNSYGWRPFLPWNAQWYYGDIAFVVDPWLWLGLGGALLLVTATTRARRIAWGGLFVVLALPVLLFGGISWASKLGWLLLAVLFFVARTFLHWEPHAAQKVMRIALTAMLVYFGTLIWLQRTAVGKMQSFAPQLIPSGEQIRAVDAMPVPGTPLSWRTVISTEQAFYFGDLHLFSHTPPPLRRYQRESGAAAVITAARGESEFQAFLRFARFPSILTNPQQDQTTKVEVRDLRFFDRDVGTSPTFHLSLHFDAQLRRIVE